jgi:hypothetical protein
MSKLLPYRSISEYDVINLFSTVENVLEAGTLVSIASSDPTADPIYKTTNTADLGSASHVLNPYYVNPNKVQTATSGAMAYTVLGITLNDVKSEDSLGRKLIYDRQKLTELDSVLSGQSVPIATKGLFYLNDSAYIGTPAINSLGIVGNGVIEVVTYAELTGKGMTEDYVVGKFISTSGNCGGYNRAGGGAYFLLG